MVKILLTADIHLGLKENELRLPENLRIKTFKKICTIAKEHDLFLIAGDLFDNCNINPEIIDIVSSEFQEIKARGTVILYTPGEAEMDGEERFPGFLKEVNANHVFTITDRPYIFTKDLQRIFIYGFPSIENDIKKIRKVSKEGFHIGLFHVNFKLKEEADISGVYSLLKDDINNLDLNFYALGHQHNFRLLKYLDNIIGVYPGSPEAASYSETGDRYILSFMIENNIINNMRRMIVNSVKVKNIEIDCSGLNNDEEIIKIVESQKVSDCAIKIILTGKRNFILNIEKLRQSSIGFLDMKIDDRTLIDINLLIKNFIDEDSLRGKFYRVLKEKIENNDLPSELNIKELTNVINSITINETYFPEDWLCR